MKTVWKFPINKNVGVYATFDMPEVCETLFVGMQGGVVTIWALVLPGGPQKTRSFFYSGTGHPVPLRARYIGSAMDGEYVWHVWEDLSPVRAR